jgi:hypothetical protein
MKQWYSLMWCVLGIGWAREPIGLIELEEAPQWAPNGLVSQFVASRLQVDLMDSAYPRRSVHSCGEWDWLRETNETYQQEVRITRELFSEILQQVDRSVNPKYFPRTLSTNQISWKSRAKSDPQNRNASAGALNCTESVDNYSTEGGACVNGTWAAKANQSDNSNGSLPSTTSSSAVNSSETSLNDTRPTHEIIHRFLVFAVLLPQHLFSTDLLEALRIVTPLFPDVTVVIGSAHEFVEFCAQYNVRSFPKLLFFKQGMLKNKYRGNLNPWELAEQFSLWTELMPRAIPDPGPPYKWILPTRVGAEVKAAPLPLGRFTPPHIGSFINRTTNVFSANASIGTRFWYMLYSRNFEPFSATSEFLAKHDPKITLLCGVFVVSRLTSRVYWYLGA